MTSIFVLVMRDGVLSSSVSRVAGRPQHVRRATDLQAMRTLTNAAQPFERIVVVSSSPSCCSAWPRCSRTQSLVRSPVGRCLVLVCSSQPVSNVPLVPLVFLPRGKVFDAAFERAEAEGSVTRELASAWADPVVRGAHVYELATATTVLILMLTQPF
jgi:hypothetical protein